MELGVQGSGFPLACLPSVDHGDIIGKLPRSLVRDLLCRAIELRSSDRFYVGCRVTGTVGSVVTR